MASTPSLIAAGGTGCPIEGLITLVSDDLGTKHRCASAHLVLRLRISIRKSRCTSCFILLHSQDSRSISPLHSENSALQTWRCPRAPCRPSRDIGLRLQGWCMRYRRGFATGHLSSACDHAIGCSIKSLINFISNSQKQIGGLECLEQEEQTWIIMNNE